jgi:hypothetical protein
MATPEQVKQALELTLNLVLDVEFKNDSLLSELLDIANKIQQNLLPSVVIEPNVKILKHPVDALLKKGKVELTEGRYKQLIQIHDQLAIFKIKFLSAKQNQNVTWFPLEWNGDKSAALYLSSSEWSVAPIKYRDDNDLTGEWEGFDLTEFMAMNCPKFDQDEY